MESFDEATEQGGDAAGDLLLAPLSVGIAGIVGDIDDRRIRKQRTRRFEDRKAADAGIEEEQGRVLVHCCCALHANIAGAIAGRLPSATNRIP